MKKSILVTGGRGFLGTALGRILDDLSLPWKAFEGDVRHYEDFLKYKDIDCVVHLAAKSRVLENDLFDLFEINVGGTFNAVRFACSQGASFFFTSTCCYAQKSPIPTPVTASLSPYSAYARSKICAEDLIRNLAEEFGLNGCVFRLFNLYGPDQPRGFVVPDYLDKLPADTLILANPDAIRDFIHVDDAARLIAKATEICPSGMHCANAGTGVGHSIKELVDMICREVGSDPDIEFKKMPMLIPTSIADIAQTKSLFGWEPEILLEAGIAQIVAAAGMQSG